MNIFRRNKQQILSLFLMLSILFFGSGCSSGNEIKGKFVFWSLNRVNPIRAYTFLYKNNKIKTLLTPAFYPAWSPDGKTIAYSTYLKIGDGEKTYGIGLIDENANKKDFIKTDGSVGVMDWSTDGMKICYSLDKGKVTDRGDLLYIYDFVTKTHTKIFEAGINSNILRVEYCPMERKILFCVYDQKNPSWTGKWLVNEDGSGLKEITSLGDSNWSWYPDGTHIAYIKYKDENGKLINGYFGAIFKLDIKTDKSEMMQLCNRRFMMGLKVSRDGKYFYYTANAPGGGRATFVSPMDNPNKIIQITQPVDLGHGNYSQDEDPNWYQGN